MRHVWVFVDVHQFHARLVEEYIRLTRSGVVMCTLERDRQHQQPYVMESRVVACETHPCWSHPSLYIVCLNCKI